MRYGCGEGVLWNILTVLLDGEPVSTCLLYAVQIEGREIVTLLGLLGEDESLHPLQESFLRLGGSQCRLCATPGSSSRLTASPREIARPSRDEIRRGLAAASAGARATPRSSTSDRVLPCGSGRCGGGDVSLSDATLAAISGSRDR